MSLHNSLTLVLDVITGSGSRVSGKRRFWSDKTFIRGIHKYITLCEQQNKRIINDPRSIPKFEKNSRLSTFRVFVGVLFSHNNKMSKIYLYFADPVSLQIILLNEFEYVDDVSFQS